MYNKTSVYVAACLGMAFFGVAFIVMGSVLPDITAKFNLDPVQASSLVTFLPVGVLLGSLVFGPIVDRFGYRSLLIVSTFIALSGLMGLSWFNQLNPLRVCIFMIGFGGGMLNGSTNALASDLYEGKDRGAKLSILGACYGVGALLIPVLLSALSGRFTYEAILRGTGFFMLLCIVYFIVIKFPKPKFTQGVPVKQMFKMAKQPLLLVLSFFLFFQSGLEGLFNNWTTTYLGSAGMLDKEDGVLLLSFFVLGMTVARLILSKLLGTISDFYVLIGGITIVILGVAGIHYTTGFTASAVSLFMCGFGLAAGFPIMIGHIGSLHPETSGTAIGLALFIALFGNSLLNYLMGYISRYFEIGSFPVFLVILLIMQLCIVFTNKKSLNTKN